MLVARCGFPPDVAKAATDRRLALVCSQAPSFTKFKNASRNNSKKFWCFKWFPVYFVTGSLLEAMPAITLHLASKTYFGCGTYCDQVQPQYKRRPGRGQCCIPWSRSLPPQASGPRQADGGHQFCHEKAELVQLGWWPSVASARSLGLAPRSRIHLRAKFP